MDALGDNPSRQTDPVEEVVESHSVDATELRQFDDVDPAFPGFNLRDKGRMGTELPCDLGLRQPSVLSRLP